LVLVEICLPLDATMVVVGGSELPGNGRRVRDDGHTRAGALELIGDGADEALAVLVDVALLIMGWH
jgi:hypothetical protein